VCLKNLLSDLCGHLKPGSVKPLTFVGDFNEYSIQEVNPG